MKQDEKFASETIRKAITEAQQWAPKIEGALSEIKETAMRASMGAALLSYLLGLPARSPQSPRALASHTGRRRRAERTAESGGVSLAGTQGRRVQEELRVKGYHHNAADVRMSLLRLARKKLLKRIAADGKGKVFEYVRR